VDQALTHRSRCIQIADLCQEHPSSQFERRLHAGACAIGADVVVKLRERCEVLREVNDRYVEITTPYLDRHNDYTQIYVRRENGAFMLTDGGETIQDLRASGCDLETSKRKDLLTSTLNGFGIRRDGDALLVKATPQDFSLRKHNLVQAILAVNDLFYLWVPVVASLFLEDVTAWLELHDIRFTPNVKFTGRSGYDHTFDFVVPASRRAPERLIRAVNRPSRDLAESLAFSWVDTKEVRPAESRFYAFLNELLPQRSSMHWPITTSSLLFGARGTAFVKSWRPEHRPPSLRRAIERLKGGDHPAAGRRRPLLRSVGSLSPFGFRPLTA